MAKLAIRDVVDFYYGARPLPDGATMKVVRDKWLVVTIDGRSYNFVISLLPKPKNNNQRKVTTYDGPAR